IAGIIDHRHEHNNPTSLETYELALGIVIAELREHLAEFARPGDLVHLIAESRGASEDLALELAFNRIISGVRIGDYMTGDPEARFRWAIVFADKRSNSAGLQVADLVARPLGLDYLNPTQPNHAAEIINAKEPRIIAWP
ncbi:MAG: DUF3800 domain-containing protein, partial [Paracoccus sp. (in: a-proteobacteria)]|nr:DUF3800 domain-containing protein [Paracoccus sp. (in: a-proteobacteria)]